MPINIELKYPFLVHFEGGSIPFVHNNDEVTLVIPPQDENNVVNVEIFYQGDPSVNEQNGFSFDYQQNGPISWTLSEPYGAYGWWPCKQQLYDKIDSLDMNITIPKNNKAAGMGNLVQVDTLYPDSSLVFHWEHRYPAIGAIFAIVFIITSSHKSKMDVISEVHDLLIL